MARRVEVGFEGGTVLRIDVEEDAVGTLTSALGGGDGGWAEIATEDGSCWVKLGEVVFVRVPKEGPRGVGFSGA